MKFVVHTQPAEEFVREYTQVYPICQSCIDGDHIAYGDDHRNGIEDRQDCKATESVDGQLYQCMCNPDWTELYNSLEDGSVNVFDNKAEAERAKSDLENISGGSD